MELRFQTLGVFFLVCIFAGQLFGLEHGRHDLVAIGSECHKTTTSVIPKNATTLIDFNSKIYDTTNSVTTGASWKYTAPTDGLYKVSAAISTQDGNWGPLGAFIRVELNKNGTPFAVRVVPEAGNGDPPTQARISSEIWLSRGEYVDLRVYHNGDYDLTLDSNSTLNWISVTLVEGALLAQDKRAIATRASTFVAIKGKSSTGQSINNTSDTIIDFDSIEHTSHGTVTTGESWKFTAPVGGLYRVSGHVQFAFGTEFGYRRLSIFKNNVILAAKAVEDGGTNYSEQIKAVCSISADIWLQEGDYIDLRAYQNSGVARALSGVSGYNWITISRLNHASVADSLLTKVQK